MKTNTKASNKRIVSLILLVTLMMLPVSAVILHVSHGTKMAHTWLHLHVLLGIIFVVAAIFHIIYNWRALKHYLLG